jgi:hypothetical protein
MFLFFNVHIVWLLEIKYLHATGWMIGVLGFDFPQGLGIFLFTTASRTALESTHPPIQWVQGGSFLGGKAAGA